MKIAIYARVSTKDKGQDTENQLRELRQFAEASGWTIYKEYADQASGGIRGEDRTGFAAMFDDARKKRFKLVLFWSLDRLTREGALPTLQYLNELTGYGCNWKSFTEQYLDSTGMFRDAVISILAAIAKQEKARISERTKAGMETARRRGKTLGRPRKSVDVERIRAMHAEGKGVILIARELGDVSRETVRRVLAQAN